MCYTKWGGGGGLKNFDQNFVQNLGKVKKPNRIGLTYMGMNKEQLTTDS